MCTATHSAIVLRRQKVDTRQSSVTVQRVCEWRHSARFDATSAGIEHMHSHAEAARPEYTVRYLGWPAVCQPTVREQRRACIEFVPLPNEKMLACCALERMRLGNSRPLHSCRLCKNGELHRGQNFGTSTVAGMTYPTSPVIAGLYPPHLKDPAGRLQMASLSNRLAAFSFLIDTIKNYPLLCHKWHDRYLREERMQA